MEPHTALEPGGAAHRRQAADQPARPEETAQEATGGQRDPPADPSGGEPGPAAARPGREHDPSAAPPPATSADGAIRSVRSALELVGLVAAPTALLTALAFYFGWVLTNARASYFGLDASTLGFSTEDYLLRSTDALFVPLGTILVIALGAVWLHELAVGALGDPGRRALVRRAAQAAIAAGAAIFAVGVVAVFEPLSFSPHYLFAPVSPGLGIVLLAYGVHLRARYEGRPVGAHAPRSRALGAVLIGALVVLSAFWTASTYADALGRGRGERLAANLDARPHVTVYASQRLELGAAGVAERRLPARDSAYAFSYSGLRLLVRSGGKYFMVPADWTRSDGTAIVLDDRPEYRFEFGTGG